MEEIVYAHLQIEKICGWFFLLHKQVNGFKDIKEWFGKVWNCVHRTWLRQIGKNAKRITGTGYPFYFGFNYFYLIKIQFNRQEGFLKVRRIVLPVSILSRVVFSLYSPNKKSLWKIKQSWREKRKKHLPSELVHLKWLSLTFSIFWISIDINMRIRPSYGNYILLIVKTIIGTLLPNQNVK